MNLVDLVAPIFFKAVTLYGHAHQHHKYHWFAQPQQEVPLTTGENERIWVALENTCAMVWMQQTCFKAYNLFFNARLFFSKSKDMNKH
jgi:hypothetical protein